MNVYELYAQALEYHKAKNYDAALKILNDIKKLAPDYKKAYMLESLIWKDLCKPLEEAVVLEILLNKFDVSLPDEKSHISYVLTRLGDIAVDVGHYKLGIKNLWLASKFAGKSSPNDFSGTLLRAAFFANAAENFSAADFQELYDDYRKYLSDIVPYPTKFYNHKKIRVGFMSADFRKCSLMCWASALLTKLDRNFFGIYFYSNGKTNDDVTKQLRSIADGWHDIRGQEDAAVARFIRDDEIDIRFDLSGHVAGNRLSVAAYRPATVQMSGVGYMNSTGLDCFDYFLSDIYCAGDENFFTEKVIKLPHSHICYKTSTELEPADVPPCLKNNFVTFGSFNQFHKVTDSILTAWKKISDAVPNSRLILKTYKLDTDAGKNFVKERLKIFGFDLKRIELRGFDANPFAEYADMDIALDTFPYTGGVTTCDALYMGVPVVSLYGSRHGTRFGLSILKNIGLDELAVDSYEEYVNRAVALASDWELLKIFRKNLRLMMKKSPLMDSENYIREIQEAFVKILNEKKNSLG